MLAVLVAVGALVVGWQLAATGEQIAPETTSAAEQAESLDVVREDRATPTPFFGNYRSMHLYLPIAPESLTEIAFHQASGDYAQHIESLLPDADMVAAEANRGTGRTEVASSDASTDRVLEGSVLRMWRSNRTGPPDTAVDVGAAAGTPVYAPVTGDVIEIRPYSLYGECDDFEIHIRPTGWPEIDLVMIHVDAPSVQAGDHVVGGVTQIAQVRLLSDRITHQISAYTRDGGDHVHLQLNLKHDQEPGALDGS